MKNKQRVRVLLDSNVWRYVADEHAGPDLLRAVRAGGVEIQVAPSVLYEALRTKDAELRKRLASLMTLSQWQRLMPEAYSECQELLGEIRRLRPGWLRAVPDLNAFRRFRFDWRRSRGGFWERARISPDNEAGHIAESGEENLTGARLESERRRREFSDLSWSKAMPLDTAYVEPSRSIAGWNGDRIEAWRGDAWSSTTCALQTLGHPYVDWLSPEVDISRIMHARSSWVQFWFHDVDVRAMPRFWLRWAFEFLQRFRRFTDGTPCDAQLATYLPESDLVVSADKAFIQIANRCGPFAPCRLPATELIPGGRQGVDALLSQLSNK